MGTRYGLAAGKYLPLRRWIRTATFAALAGALAFGSGQTPLVAQPPVSEPDTADEQNAVEKPAAARSNGAPPDDTPPPPNGSPPADAKAAPGAKAAAEAKPVEHGKLPWSKAGTSRVTIARPRVTSARQLLVTLDDSQLDNFFDRQPLNISEDETLYRILYRLPNVGQHHIERLVTHDVAWQTLVDDPAAHRIEIFKLTGRVQKVVRTDLLPEMAKRLEFNHYYRVTLQLDDAPNPVLLCARYVPEAWLEDESLNERASAFGLFLKVGDVSGPHSELVFVTPRVAWHPDRLYPQGGIGADQILLGDLGFDWGLFDKVRGLNAERLTAEEKEPFYQLLAAANRADEQDLARRGAGQFDLVALLQRPREQHGRVMSLRGAARAVKRIEIGDPELRERIGFDHYFEIDMFVSLGNEIVRLTEKNSDHAGPVYTTGFPVVCCVVRLPDEWLRRTDIVGNENLNEDVRVDGFHYKLYAYESEFLSRFRAENEGPLPATQRRPRQPSPMFIAATVQPLPPATTPFPNAGWLVMVVIVTFVSATGLVVWLYNRGDRPIRDAARKRLTEIEGGKSLNDLNLDVRQPPTGPERFGS